MKDAAGQAVQILDLRSAYTLEEVKALFDTLGAEGRQVYATVAGRTDMAFPLAYGTFFVLVLAHSRRWGRAPLAARACHADDWHTPR